MAEPEGTGIGTLNEGPLHAELKQWYARPGDELEVRLDGYVIDIVRDDLLIEVQTGNFYPVRDKLRELIDQHPVRLVYPLARQKWLLKLPENGEGEPSRRRSPKHCTELDASVELVHMPRLLAHPNFSLHIVLIHMEEVRRREPGRAWRRRGWVIQKSRLLDVVKTRLLETPAQMADLLPHEMEEPFGTADLAEHGNISRSVAQKACYCLRKMGSIERVGRRGNAYLYRICKS